MRENRLHGSEGGEGASSSLPLSWLYTLQSIKLVQFATEDVLPEDAKPPLYRSLHKLAIQLALDNRFFFDFPDFPDTSLTEYEITQTKDRIRELTFELDHEETLRRDFLEQLATILTGFYKFYPQTSGNLSERWLHKFGRCGKWNFCLTTGTLVPANQERQ